MRSDQARLEAMQARLSQCRRCVEAGYFIGSRPVFSGPATAQVMIVGQAPAQVEAGQAGQPFGPRRGGRRSLLWDWLAQAGWSETEFRTNHYLSAVTKCYPGKRPAGRGDRVPTAAERALCRFWLEQELAIIQPRLIIPLGRVAIEQFRPELKGQPLASFIGQQFQAGEAVIVPLPHPSGRSRWLNQPEHQSLLEQALARLRHLRATIDRDG